MNTTANQQTGERQWNSFATPAIGKAVRAASRLLKHGGSAFPGKVVERIDPGFLARTLGTLPYGVVLVSGTNGKTTTTRMVASMLSDLGLRVFTNPTGSNFTRGVVSALLTEVGLDGKLNADIAVLELDEAYAVHFVRQCKPRYALLLNVMRDQLDRFGEIDNTARLLGKVAQATTDTLVLNREDRRISALAEHAPSGTQTRYFGLDNSLRAQFPTDDDMHASSEGADAGTPPNIADVARGEVSAEQSEAQSRCTADVVLKAVGDHHAEFVMDDALFDTDVRLEGLHNLFNAAAALAVVRAVMADVNAGREVKSEPRAQDERLMQVLSHVTPAFGRGEVIEVNGAPVELLLVKNPMGFRMSLAGAAAVADNTQTMIAINDEYADGRDMSWLWDVDFTALRPSGVESVSGVRAWDMALRLEYDQVPVNGVDTDLEGAVRRFVTDGLGKPKRVYCTYTAMLRVRAELATMADVSDAGVGK